MDQIMQAAEKIRRFNRFYLPYFHLITQKYLNSDYSVAEARILYEIYDRREISAREIVNALHVDKGYLSRILKRFEASAIIERKVSETDCRRVDIMLTESGEVLSERLVEESNQQIAKELEGLSQEDIDQLLFHMKEIIHILGGNKHAAGGV